MGVGSGVQDTGVTRDWKARILGSVFQFGKHFGRTRSCVILAAAFRTPGILGSLPPNLGMAAQVSLCDWWLPSSSQSPEILAGVGRPTWHQLGFKTPEAPRTKRGGLGRAKVLPVTPGVLPAQEWPCLD